jgi:hypothetical protein
MSVSKSAFALAVALFGVGARAQRAAVARTAASTSAST